MTLTLTNTGNTNLVIGTTSITGTDHSDFAIVTDASGQTVPAGGVTHMKLTTRPSTPGSKVANLMIPSNAAGSPLPVALSAVGV